mmetsp:Transcript_12728/g.29000  ORF Transcript_12728/g.29000 Transcript_12728/m.29000 type:complete len:227 (+) Transcript_12728:1303-1983(+)
MQSGEAVLILKINVRFVTQQIPQHIVVSRTAGGRRHSHQGGPAGWTSGIDIDPELKESVTFTNHAVLGSDQKGKIPHCAGVPVLYQIMHDYMIHRLGNLDQGIQRCPCPWVGQQASLVGGLLGHGYQVVLPASLLQYEPQHLPRYLPPRVRDAEHQYHQPLANVEWVLGHLPVCVVQPVRHGQCSKIVLKAKMCKTVHFHPRPCGEGADNWKNSRFAGLHQPTPDI